MEAVYYPCPEDISLALELHIKNGGDVKKWAEGVKEEVEKELFKPYCKKWICQMEKGEEKGKYHMQMYFELHVKQRCATLAGSVGHKLKGISIREASVAGANAIQYYCAKDKTRVAGPWASVPLSMVQAPTSWDLKEIEDSPYPWQKALIDMVTKKCSDDRCIHWVYDPQGCSGKSKLTKLLTAKKLAIPVQYGSARDLANIIYNNKGANAYLFDLTRAKPESMPGDDVYSVMEAAKNGMVQNTKYETGISCFDPPHMIVFANVKPEFKKLTMDRWVVWCIDGAAQLVRWHKKGDTPKLPARTISSATTASIFGGAPPAAPGGPRADDMEVVPAGSGGHFTTAGQMIRDREALWSAYWKAVAAKWKLDIGQAYGVSCMHNAFGCDDCDTRASLCDEFDPPLL